MHPQAPGPTMNVGFWNIEWQGLLGLHTGKPVGVAGDILSTPGMSE